MTHNTSTQPTSPNRRGTLVSDEHGVQTITTPDGDTIILRGLSRNKFAKVGDSGDILTLHTSSGNGAWDTFYTDLEALAGEFLSQPGGQPLPHEAYQTCLRIVREAFDMGRMFEKNEQLRTSQAVLSNLDEAIHTIQSLQD